MIRILVYSLAGVLALPAAIIGFIRTSRELAEREECEAQLKREHAERQRHNLRNNDW